MDWSQKALPPYKGLKHPGLPVIDFRAAGLFLSNMAGFQASSHWIHFLLFSVWNSDRNDWSGRTSCIFAELWSHSSSLQGGWNLKFFCGFQETALPLPVSSSTPGGGWVGGTPLSAVLDDSSEYFLPYFLCLLEWSRTCVCTLSWGERPCPHSTTFHFLSFPNFVACKHWLHFNGTSLCDSHSFVLLCFYSLLLLDLILVLALFKDIGDVFSILTLNRVPSSGTWSGAPPQASLSLGLGQQTPWQWGTVYGKHDDKWDCWWFCGQIQSTL